MKQILCISRQAPYAGNLAREALDAVLAAAIFDQTIGLLFMDDGVYQLLQGQNSEVLEQKNLGKMLSALELYGVENIYVHTPSLQNRGIMPEHLLLDDIQLLDDRLTQQLMAQQDHLLSF
ncbi:MAG TPA: sulfurtransferase complex subunit TusC [Cellvibrionaceae bacterium]